MVFLREPPSTMAIMEPPGGESRIGVRNEIPSSPYFLQILTKRLFFAVKIFLGLKNFFKIPLLILLPKKVNIVTVVIMPDTVISTVNKGEKPAA